jgi:hypothetical protein
MTYLSVSFSRPDLSFYTSQEEAGGRGGESERRQGKKCRYRCAGGSQLRQAPQYLISFSSRGAFLTGFGKTVQAVDCYGIRGWCAVCA